MHLKQFSFQMFGIVAATAAAFGADGVRGVPTVTFRHDDGASAMRMPTAVAVGPTDDVFVLDGVHERVLVFRADGTFAREITAFGEQRLSQPVGLRVTPDGELWVADSGNGRVLVGLADGTLRRELPLPTGDDGRRADPTDVAVLREGLAAWIVDNDGHRLLRVDPTNGATRVVGKLGGALGQFEYPFQLAVTRAGDLIVSDVINARLQLLSSDGTPLRSIGAYGVGFGQFLRPGGVALDADGRIWAADSVIGVVQVFRQDGSFVDVLRGGDDKPLRFEAPLGIAIDAQGALYVVESRADRVRKVTIEKFDQPRPPAVGAKPAVSPAGQQSKACTLCHVDWLPAFAAGKDSDLMPRPISVKDDPVVARAEMCLSCHDGAVADSRRRVWEEHGHRTGVSPPATMTVPSHLPLIEGKLACRTCHSAHGADVPQGDFRRAMLLRVPNPASELCVSCHEDKTRGPRFGTHPTGGMPWAIPEKLIAAGAKMGPNPRELTCQVCHTPHGAKNEHLLVLGTSTNQLCVTCHDQMRPGMFRDGAHAEHPLTAKVNAEQAAAIRDMGTKMGPDGQLVCLSCHKLHHGLGQRFMLAADLAEGQMCLRCHSARREIVGSPHDLRTNFPQERNRLGLTSSEGGPCSSCHLFHRFARATTPGPGDAAGQCLTCHRPGECAQNKSLPAVNHPSLRCTECHNPHEQRFGKFLSAPTAELCVRCHAEQALLAGGPHDARGASGNFCQSGDFAADPCLSCHRPHGDEKHGLFRVAPSAGAAGSGACVACHTEAAPSAAGALALRHPTDVIPVASSGGLPGVDGGHAAAPVGCASCHDPHQTRGRGGALLRAETASGIDLCLRCHSDMRQIAVTAHGAKSLGEHGLDATGCRPCHQVHGDAREIDARRLWPQHLVGMPAERDAAGDMAAVEDQLCTGCHREGGPAARPVVATHPNVQMFEAPVQTVGAALPLVDANGTPDPHGALACRTCHLPHGRPLAPDAQFSLAGERTKETAAQRLQLRTFDAPNVCTSCHGADALRRFLYFHDPERRGGPLSVSR